MLYRRWSPLGRMLVLSLVLFVLTSVIGYQTSQAPGGGETSRSAIEALAKALSPMTKLDPPLMMAAIFLNNAIKALVVIVLGFAFGIVPVVFLAVNGVIIGLVVGLVVGMAGPWVAVAALAPHGVIEIPALLLASALGLRVAGAVIKRITGRPANPGWEFKNGLVVYAKFVLPALFVAAVIEVFITPLLIRR